jgi:ACS family glucarate transporter-like MFS transporter
MIASLQGRVRWILIVWIFMISSVAYLDRVNISIASHYIVKEYQLSNIQLGYIFSAFVLAYALFQPPGGRVSDKYGPRWVIGLATVWWAAFTSLATAIPRTITGVVAAFICLRFLLGAGEAVMYPASNRFVAKWIPTNERGTANGLIFAGVGAGAGITPPLITFIMLRGGWRLSFWVSALLGLVAGSVWFWLARDNPEEHPWVSAREMDVIRSGLPESSDRAKGMLPWRRILASKDFLLVTYSYFCYGYVAYIFFTWFFIYLSTVRGLNLRESSYFATLPFIAMAICSPAGGVLSDWITRHYGKRWGRCGVAVLGIGLSGVFVASGSAVSSPRLASIVLAGGAGALYLSQSTFWSVTADIAGESAGSVSGVMNMGAQIGSTVTATLTPVIAARFGWRASFGLAAFLCATGALAWLRVDPTRKLTLPVVGPSNCPGQVL